MDEKLLALLGSDRLASRQIDELVGIARGLIADDNLNHAEIEFLQAWLAANLSISNHPVINKLYQRVNAILADGIIEHDEALELLCTLRQFAGSKFELGEVLTSTDLPLCDPPPPLSFAGTRYCFTGTFAFGQRKHCEQAVMERGAQAGALTQKTNFLVIGAYATESWKHSSFGNKIIQACEWRERGLPISVVTEQHWVAHL
ncbi:MULTISPECIES: BRCT domain-containing protein [Alphaproteobacteria]|uniref:NAD-dependent DNA ligase n=2 Tax=Alphaproteobacteria TaxID=28211 RepID=A0A512HD66_9HYPH|nr:MULTISPECIES: BRCT domain-containing protein [Alphaproteobacteria]GEO83402.1 hypothetical protein RNA01_03340 [Ciceribacter naphthalenivorans]GLR23025.1 hypothetical protein GCM10007920_28130 [Ciceribacter naphthalenivorans]GLT05881.1 hypothetical protein GCM10007926_28130 [Sphingomonas psychrolutea]